MVGPAGIAFEGDGTIKVAFHPARVLLLPIVNRGRTYPVPSEHLGKPFSDTSVVHLASLGLDFYRTVVTAAESHFVKV